MTRSMSSKLSQYEDRCIAPVFLVTRQQLQRSWDFEIDEMVSERASSYFSNPTKRFRCGDHDIHIVPWKTVLDVVVQSVEVLLSLWAFGAFDAEQRVDGSNPTKHLRHVVAVNQVEQSMIEMVVP